MSCVGIKTLRVRLTAAEQCAADAYAGDAVCGCSPGGRIRAAGQVAEVRPSWANVAFPVVSSPTEDAELYADAVSICWCSGLRKRTRRCARRRVDAENLAIDIKVLETIHKYPAATNQKHTANTRDWV